MNKLLIVYAHPAPHRSRVNVALRQAVEGLEGVTLCDLYETYPDFLINIAREQELLVRHDVIVLQHPMYWYSGPALLKEWLDVVLEHGFAYGERGTALRGKALMQALSSGGREPAFRHDGSSHFTLAELLRPFEQTAYLCGMRYLQPYWVPGTHYIDAARIAHFAEGYRQRLTALRDGVAPGPPHPEPI